MSSIARGLTAVALAGACAEPGCASEVDPGLRDYAVAVTAFTPGEAAGFGRDLLPDVVLGPPRGGGVEQGSVDVLSLGRRGEITLELGREVLDGEGPDLIVFENAFIPAGSELPFSEPAEVSVSTDGHRFETFPCRLETAPRYEGCAGVTPVLAHPDDASLDPRNPKQAGGDAFDLAAVGVQAARFVRIRDLGAGLDLGPNTGGFDLDAIAIASGR